MRSRAVREFEEIWITPVRSAVSYAVALHEIGHVLGRHQKSKPVLVRERYAWEWARRNATRWTPRMEKHAREAWAWYAARGRATKQKLQISSEY